MHPLRICTEGVVFVVFYIQTERFCFPSLPQTSIHTSLISGQTRVTERRREIIMSNANNNQLNIPQAREAMDRFKMLI